MISTGPLHVAPTCIDIWWLQHYHSDICTLIHCILLSQSSTAPLYTAYEHSIILLFCESNYIKSDTYIVACARNTIMIMYNIATLKLAWVILLRECSKVTLFRSVCCYEHACVCIYLVCVCAGTSRRVPSSSFHQEVSGKKAKFITEW